VALLDEAVEVWRPVRAERVGSLFRLLDETPEGEIWQFSPGQIVRCESKLLAEGRDAFPRLVAVEAVNY
jgi:hypothetical protein